MQSSCSPLRCALKRAGQHALERLGDRIWYGTLLWLLSCRHSHHLCSLAVDAQLVRVWQPVNKWQRRGQ